MSVRSLKAALLVLSICVCLAAYAAGSELAASAVVEKGLVGGHAHEHMALAFALAATLAALATAIVWPSPLPSAVTTLVATVAVSALLPFASAWPYWAAVEQLTDGGLTMSSALLIVSVVFGVGNSRLRALRVH